MKLIDKLLQLNNENKLDAECLKDNDENIWTVQI